MKRALLGLLFCLPALCQQVQIGQKASDFGIQTGTDKYVWLSEYAGKTRIFAVIQTTCPHCQFTTGILNKLQTEYAAKGVQILATAIEPMSSLHIADFQKNFHPQFPVGYSDQNYVLKFLGMNENEPMFVPQLVFIDKNGVIRDYIGGEDKRFDKTIQEKSLREALDKTLQAGAGAAPAKK